LRSTQKWSRSFVMEPFSCCKSGFVFPRRNIVWFCLLIFRLLLSWCCRSVFSRLSDASLNPLLACKPLLWCIRKTSGCIRRYWQCPPTIRSIPDCF
jgi:hypothetical protein